MNASVPQSQSALSERKFPSTFGQHRPISLPDLPRASVRDQATRISFNQPVRVPGKILPAGTYWFVLSNVGAADRDTVSIYSSDWSKGVRDRID